jgi:anti-sigma B factor antagonist
VRNLIMEEKVDIEINRQQDRAIVVFKSVQVCSAEGIADAGGRVLDYIEKNNPKLVIVDFEKVKFFSSQVLGLLLNIRNRLEENGGELLISAINPQLYRVFKITNLDKIFQFFPDRDSAVKQIPVK